MTWVVFGLLVVGGLVLLFAVLGLMLWIRRRIARRELQRQQPQQQPQQDQAAAAPVAAATVAEPQAPQVQARARRQWLSRRVVGTTLILLVVVVAVFFFREQLATISIPEAPSISWEDVWEWYKENFAWTLPYLLLLLVVVAILATVVAFTSSSGSRMARATILAMVLWGSFLYITGAFQGLSWPSFGQRVATAPVTPLEYRPIYLDGTVRVVNQNLQQARLDVQSAGCALVYNQAGRYIGKICPGVRGVVNGLAYSAKSESGQTLLVDLTICPLGSPGINTGSCN